MTIKFRFFKIVAYNFSKKNVKMPTKSSMKVQKECNSQQIVQNMREYYNSDQINNDKINLKVVAFH